MPKSSNPFDELAAMFLTGTNGPHASGAGAMAIAPHLPPTAPSAPIAPHTSATAALPRSSPTQAKYKTSKPKIELLIVGHLPVRGNLWLAPYADAMARQFGPTALLRIDGPDPGVQILQGASQHASILTSAPWPLLVAEISDDINLWIIRAPNETAIGEWIEHGGRGVDRITIITSADEAAQVAAHQIVTELADTSVDLPPIHLAVVGTDPATADAVLDRLNQTVQNFLKVEIRPGLCLSRMEASVRPMHIMRLENAAAVSLSTAVESIAQQPPRTHAVSNEQNGSVIGRVHSERTDTPPFRSVSATTSATPRAATPRANTAPTPWPVQAATLTNVLDDLLSPRPVKLAPKPSRTVEPKHDAAAETREPQSHESAVKFTAHVSGLTALPVRAPQHDLIELALDADGRVHLLAPESALRELPLVSKWVQLHHQLLAMACRPLMIDPKRTPRAHVFSETPATLGDLHGSDICLHVLAPVIVHGQKGWYSAPLNTVQA